MRTPLEPRLRRRRRLVWATVLPALVLLVLAVRFLTLPVNMGSAQDAHGVDDGDGMVGAAEKLDVLNIVERWRAPFVKGTGTSMSGDLVGGRAELEEALSRTSTPEDDCTVRTNLVITISQQADEAEEAGDEDAKKKFAEEGLQLIKEGPKGCLDGSDDGNGGDAGRKQQEEQDKLEEQAGQKEEDEGDEGEDEDRDEEQDGGGDSEEQDPKKKELEERNQQGQQESEEKRRQNEAEEEGESGGVDKPW